MKILSMYLPQYHRVKENDEWWGEGFTDWITTKEARPLFDGHYEPHIPLNNYYYDLTERESFIYQQKLMEKYGIDGQCFYHYWFKDGRKILEKPAEYLLEWKDIEIPFCFSWANQTWARSWANIHNANSWCDYKEKKEDKENHSNDILLEQSYGGEDDWKEHFDYLKPFFKDDRYIKHENKPVFLIYQAGEMHVLGKMKKLWNELAQKEGFDGVYFIGANDANNDFDACLYPAPKYGMSLEYSEYLDNGLRIEDYSAVNERLISLALAQKGGVGAFVGYDDTPRRGLKGCTIKNGSPELFKAYLTKILAINEVNGQPFTFINAWNEWGEGMHLEPDEKYGLAFLEAVACAKKEYKIVAEGISLVLHGGDEGKIQMMSKCNRYESYWRCFRKWIELYQNGVSISRLFAENDISEIVIYGLGMVGKMLVKDIEEENIIKIVFGIDQREKGDEFSFKTYLLDDSPKYEGTVVVTALYDFDEIKKQLLNRGYAKVVSISTLLFNDNDRLN